MEQSIGKQIAAYRKKLGMTQEQLAKHMDVTNQAVSKWETDQSCPDIQLLPRLADLFEISLDALVEKRDLHREGPPGKYVLGVVTVDKNNCIPLTEKAMLLFGLQPGDRLLLLGDENRGLAMVPYSMYEQFARTILDAGAVDESEKNIL